MDWRWAVAGFRWTPVGRAWFCSPDRGLRGGGARIAAGITFDVQVSCGFVGATVAGVRSHVALCRLLDDQHALLAIWLEENVLGWKDFVTVFEPFDLGGSLAQLAGQNHLVLFDGGVVLELRCEVQVALCKKAYNTTSNDLLKIIEKHGS